MDDPSKRVVSTTREAYRPPRSTIDAFRYVVALDDLERLKAWLSERPNDAPFLLATLESPASC